MNNQFLTPSFNNGLSYNSSNLGLVQHSSNMVNNDRFIIDNRNVKSKDIQISNYTTDIINPIQRKEMKQLLSVDSVFRDNTETSESGCFMYSLQEPMKNVISMKLCSIELPNIWYMFSTKNRNNEFTITLKNISSGTGYFYNETHKIIIPDGNYSVIELENYLNNYFHNIKPNGSLDFLKVYIDTKTGQFVIRANSINDIDLGTSPSPYNTESEYYSPNFYFELDFILEDDPDRPLYKNCGWMLGFKDDYYQANSDDTFTDYTTYADRVITYKNIIRSEGVYGSGIYTYIFLEIDDFNNNSKDSVYSGKDLDYLHDNILAKLPVTTGSNSLMFSNSSDLIFKQRDYFGPVTIDKLKIRLINKYGDTIDLNNNNFSFTLEFTQLYN